MTLNNYYLTFEFNGKTQEAYVKSTSEGAAKSILLAAIEATLDADFTGETITEWDN